MSKVNKIIALLTVCCTMIQYASPTIQVYADVSTEQVMMEDDNIKVLVLREDAEVRVTQEVNKFTGDKVTYTFHKVTGILDTEKNGELSSVNVKQVGEALIPNPFYRAANSSLASPWSYSSSGNRYTMQIVSNGNTISKTVTRTGSNAGYIDGFMYNIDTLRSKEWDLVGAVGWSLGVTIIGALVTGGPGAVAAVGATTKMLSLANEINQIYAQARYNYFRS